MSESLLPPLPVSAVSPEPPAPATPPGDTPPALASPESKPPQPGDPKVADDAPAEYKFEMAEGFEADPEVMAEYSEFARGLKLSPENAQKGVNLATQLVERMLKRQTDAYVERAAQWAAEAKADKVLAGEDGKQLPQSLHLAKRAAQFFGGKEALDLFEQSGLGNHPVLLKFLRKIGAAMSEDMTEANPSDPVLGDKSDVERLYPQYFQPK